MNPEQLYQDANALHQGGNLAQAERLYATILAGDSRHVASLVGLATIRLQQSRYTKALEHLQSALLRDPGSIPSLVTLGTALHLTARHVEAARCFEQVLEQRNDHAEAHYGLGLTLHAMSRHEEAETSFKRALELDPDYAEASCALGATLQARQQPARAIECFDRALLIDPEYFEAICGRAESLSALRRRNEALVAYELALSIRPSSAEVHDALGLLLVESSSHEQAIERFRAALTIRPNYVDAQIHLGNALEELGRIDEAHGAFEAAVALDPTNVRPRYALIMSRDIKAGDPHLAALKEWSERTSEPNNNSKILLHFGLAKANSDMGNQDASLEQLIYGNALKRTQIHYDEAATLALFKSTRKAFTSELLRTKHGMGHPSALPIFIVGMPRSGSTLIEQILASHPDVAGGGERSDFVDAMNDTVKGALALPTILSADDLWDLGANYLKRLSASSLDPAPQRLTDKMLANFFCVGLIHLALPHARFIHAKRNAVATCLSCFSKLFGTEQPFTYDLAELGRYYRAYERLMEHWNQILPPDVMLDVEYEKLVDDFEPQARRIVEHCGLAWSTDCLAFYKNPRPVRTASVAQVRKPIYRSAVERPAPDAALIRPLLEALAGRNS